MNTHPEARFFYSLQERGRIEENGKHWFPQMTIGIVTEKVASGLYTDLAGFVEDMTLIFTDCPQDSVLGAVTLKGLFSDLLAKHTNYLDGYNTTPPGRKKRTHRPSRLHFDSEYGGEEFDEFLFASPEIFELHDEEHAALLEITEGIATIEAELQQLKDTDNDSCNPGFSTHTDIDLFQTPAYSLGTSCLFTSSSEEGRSALSQQKRSRRNILKPTPSPSLTNSKRQKVVAAQYDPVSKEQLLHIITHDLAPNFLEGLIRIVNPLFDPATACDEDFEFDINLLDDEVLLELQQYVYTSISPSKSTPGSPQKRKVPKRKPKKEAPKSRLRNQRKRMTRNSVATTQKKQRKQQQQFGGNKRKNSYVSADIMREIFQSEEIVRVRKSLDDEDEDVDILA